MLHNSQHAMDILERMKGETPSRNCPTVVQVLHPKLVPQMGLFVEQDEEMKAEEHDCRVEQQNRTSEKERLS